ncbi:MAG TPA: hypothetical protein ENN36_07165 [Candidatus Bathyarchaeota archaeon]|nr:hypothetical protein [Candidatus Bathyarchaeota archaeon]
MKMTENFRNSFLKLIYNIKKRNVVGEGTLVISDVLPYAVAVGAVVVALITIYIMRREKQSISTEPLLEIPEAAAILPLKGERTVTPFDAQKSKKELRLLDVEREILSFGIRRIYEAHAEGKIDDKERDRLAENYKQRMREIKESMTEKESVVALHELESMQEDLIRLFNDRFDEINKKIGGLRTNLGIKPKPEVPTPSPAAPPSRPQKTTKKRRKPSKPKKTEAEERIEQIKSEVEKVLERLGQMETEA